MSARILGMVALGLGLGMVAILPAAAESSDPDVAAVVRGNNEFALDLYHQLLGESNQNVILSPYSISSALAMTYAGARGATETQMGDVLHVTLPQDQFHSAFGRLTGQLDPGGPSAGHELRVVNRLWGQQGYAFLPSFLETTGENYGADMGRLNYLGDADGARQTINAWVEEQTRNKIKDLLPPGSVDEWTRLVLTNAIYFRGDWQWPFDSEWTTNRAFVNEAGEQRFVPTMGLESAPLDYANGVLGPALPACQALRMPYGGGDFSMLLLLPNGSLSNFEQSLTVESFDACIDALDGMLVDVELPKFTVESEFSLNEPLETLGMTEAFDPWAADFSGITDVEPLYIQNVVHKAFIGVTEAGTEAAAATAVVIGTLGEPPPPPPVFNADHPFLYFILDDRTGSILFMGRVADPVYAVESVAILGDANADGVVDDEDASILAAHWRQQVAGWTDGDFNGDGWVNDMDAAILAAHWHAGVTEQDATTPEPSAIAYALSMLIVLVAIAWRQRGIIRR
jgi:serpin B